MIQRFNSLPGRIDAGIDYDWSTRRRRFNRFVKAMNFFAGILIGHIAYVLIGKHF